MLRLNTILFLFAAICKAGEFSPTRVSPCMKCPVGQYQPSEWSTSCEQCPTGTSTASLGATSRTECQGM